MGCILSDSGGTWAMALIFGEKSNKMVVQPFDIFLAISRTAGPVCSSPALAKFYYLSV